MEELLKKIAEYLGDPYVVAVGYAGLAYAFFSWADKDLPDEAKAALARTMRFKDYKNEQVASALADVFDRIYTYPLLRWRAFFRSLLFTTVVSAIFTFELARLPSSEPKVWAAYTCVELSIPQYPMVCNFLSWILLWISGAPIWLFNVLSDYLSLFAIRPLLIRSGTKPVIFLVLGAVSGVAIVLVGFILRVVVNDLFDADLVLSTVPLFSLPALAVFVWLPLLALGILIARLLTPLSWIVGRIHWKGEEHPLKVIGYIVAVVVFLGTVAGRAVFSA